MATSYEPKAIMEIVLPDTPQIPEGMLVDVGWGDTVFKGVVKFSDSDGYICVEERDEDQWPTLP